MIWVTRHVQRLAYYACTDTQNDALPGAYLLVYHGEVRYCGSGNKESLQLWLQLWVAENQAVPMCACAYNVAI